MTDDELDRLVAVTAPISDEHLTALPLEISATELCEAIMSIPLVDEIPIAQRPHRPWWRSRVMAAAAVVLAVLAIGSTFTTIGGGSDRAWAEPLVEFAESSPQLLLDGGGWEVDRADQYGDGEGEMTFISGERQAELFWRADPYQQWADDRANSAALIETVTVLGQPAQVTQYAGTDDFSALWPEADRTIEFRAQADDLGDFVGLLGALKRVDVDSWLWAMPESVIKSAERNAVVEAMLADVPLPEGFDIGQLVSTGGVSDRYQLGAQVTGAVGCAWVEQWIAATGAGDTAGATQAVEAMATSHGWAILDEMSNQGAWPQVFWEIADGMTGDGTTGSGQSVVNFYGPAIGCSE